MGRAQVHEAAQAHVGPGAAVRSRCAALAPLGRRPARSRSALADVARSSSSYRYLPAVYRPHLRLRVRHRDRVRRRRRPSLSSRSASAPDSHSSSSRRSQHPRHRLCHLHIPRLRLCVVLSPLESFSSRAERSRRSVLHSVPVPELLADSLDVVARRVLAQLHPVRTDARQEAVAVVVSRMELALFRRRGVFRAVAASNRQCAFFQRYRGSSCTEPCSRERGRERKATSSQSRASRAESGEARREEERGGHPRPSLVAPRRLQPVQALCRQSPARPSTSRPPPLSARRASPSRAPSTWVLVRRPPLTTTATVLRARAPTLPPAGLRPTRSGPLASRPRRGSTVRRAPSFGGRREGAAGEIERRGGGFDGLGGLLGGFQRI